VCAVLGLDVPVQLTADLREAAPPAEGIELGSSPELEERCGDGLTPREEDLEGDMLTCLAA
jgi:hypothetical protein